MEFVQELDDEDTPDTALAPFVDEDCNEVDGYTGCDSEKALCEHMEAAMLAGQPFSEKVNGIMLEFNQVRDPENYSVEGKHGLFKLVGDPYRSKILYGYDQFGAWHYADRVLRCHAMIMRKDGEPTGYILCKLCKTRCSRPRIDAFLYHAREDQ